MALHFAIFKLFAVHLQVFLLVHALSVVFITAWWSVSYHSHSYPLLSIHEEERLDLAWGKSDSSPWSTLLAAVGLWWTNISGKNYHSTKSLALWHKMIEKKKRWRSQKSKSLQYTPSLTMSSTRTLVWGSTI